MAKLGRPKSKNGVKVHATFKIYQKDKEKAQELADKKGVSLSSYINNAVIERIKRDDTGDINE